MADGRQMRKEEGTCVRLSRAEMTEFLWVFLMLVPVPPYPRLAPPALLFFSFLSFSLTEG